jgi:hypothetical protein
MRDGDVVVVGSSIRLFYYAPRSIAIPDFAEEYVHRFHECLRRRGLAQITLLDARTPSTLKGTMRKSVLLQDIMLDSLTEMNDSKSLQMNR